MLQQTPDPDTRQMSCCLSHLFFLIFGTEVWKVGRQSCRTVELTGQDSGTQIASVLRETKSPLIVHIVHLLADLWCTLRALSDFGERSELNSLFFACDLCPYVKKLLNHLMLIPRLHHHGNAVRHKGGKEPLYRNLHKRNSLNYPNLRLLLGFSNLWFIYFFVWSKLSGKAEWRWSCRNQARLSSPLPVLHKVVLWLFTLSWTLHGPFLKTHTHPWAIMHQWHSRSFLKHCSHNLKLIVCRSYLKKKVLNFFPFVFVALCFFCGAIFMKNKMDILQT